MKKSKMYLLIAGFCILVNINVANANENTGHHPKAPNKDSIEIVLHRLNQINAMDFSKLDRKEKKALRKEVHSIHKILETKDGGIYLSVGGIIIILLILILIL